MKFVKVLSVLAVFAAAGMAAAGCDSPAGIGDGYDEVVSGEASAPALNSAGDGASKTIKVKFEVKNGGGGLVDNAGIVSTQDDSYLVYNEGSFSRDYTINITVPASDEYLNIRWLGNDFWYGAYCVRAKMKPESGAITLDYNGPVSEVTTKNLYDVHYRTGNTNNYYVDWTYAKKRAGK